MERLLIEPRKDWSDQIEALGYDFYQLEGVRFWEEGAYYKFSADEIDVIEAAGNTLHQLCLQAVDHIVRQKLYPLLGIEADVGKLIEKSWDRHDPYIYGRFDLIWDGTAGPKMLEYNADTPTALFEASIVQWDWRMKTFPLADQFNWIDEALIERWRALRVGRRDAELLHLACTTPMPEDETTVQYMGVTAENAGWKVQFLPMQELGWNEDRQQFTDLSEKNIINIFKLYPWEWMMADSFGGNVSRAATHFVEPIWKMILSNKAILPILWDLFPYHDNLLPAFREEKPLEGKRIVRKALLGREGANIRVTDGANVLAETDGGYAKSGYIYQEFAASPIFDGWRANIGAWVVGETCCGAVIREDRGYVVSNLSHIVPHIFQPRPAS